MRQRSPLFVSPAPIGFRIGRERAPSPRTLSHLILSLSSTAQPMDPGLPAQRRHPGQRDARERSRGAAAFFLRRGKSQKAKRVVCLGRGRRTRPMTVTPTTSWGRQARPLPAWSVFASKKGAARPMRRTRKRNKRSCRARWPAPRAPFFPLPPPVRPPRSTRRLAAETPHAPHPHFPLLSRLSPLSFGTTAWAPSWTGLTSTTAPSGASTSTPPSPCSCRAGTITRSR